MHISSRRQKKLTTFFPLETFTTKQRYSSVLHFYGRMEDLTEELEPEGFLRIQKSYLVNMAHIKKLNFDHVLLSNGEELPVSQKRYAQLKIQYLGWKNKQWGKSL